MLGLYASFMGIEHSNFPNRIWFLGSSDILCCWVWSKCRKVKNYTFRFTFIFIWCFTQFFTYLSLFYSLVFWLVFLLLLCRFLRQFLLFFFLHQMSLALFRLMGALGRNMIIANTFGSFAMLIVMALGGYIISRGETKSSNCHNLFLIKLRDKLIIYFLFSVLADRIPSWWIWGFWISPLMYAQDAASVNEFLGHVWDKVKYLKLVLSFT